MYDYVANFEQVDIHKSRRCNYDNSTSREEYYAYKSLSGLLMK